MRCYCLNSEWNPNSLSEGCFTKGSLQLVVNPAFITLLTKIKLGNWTVFRRIISSALDYLLMSFFGSETSRK